MTSRSVAMLAPPVLAILASILHPALAAQVYMPYTPEKASYYWVKLRYMSFYIMSWISNICNFKYSSI